MKCTIPEISWHNRDPVLSVDIQPKNVGNASKDFYRLASGGTDSHVLIWYIKEANDGHVNLDLAADLTRHQRAVNCVRWSPSGEYLASSDDESVIFIWKLKEETEVVNILDTTNEQDKEIWLTFKILRGHMEDVNDLSWSPNSLNLISGSVDNTAIVWDIQKGKSLAILTDHKSFVQGVAWDPKNQYLATLSADRYMRIFDASTKKVVARSSKSNLPTVVNSIIENKLVRLYHDDTLRTFYRRICFSPDGEIIIAPSGMLNIDGDKILHTSYLYTRYSLKKPAVVLPSPDQYTVAVRFCPLLFTLHDYDESNPPLIDLPYRMIFAVATKSSVYLHDSQQKMPFGVISNIHYTRLTDLTWASNGRLLIVSSTDGFCTIITFSENELGIEYKLGEEKPTNTIKTDNNNEETIQSKKLNDKPDQEPAAKQATESDSKIRSESDSKTTSESDTKTSESSIQPIEKIIELNPSTVTSPEHSKIGKIFKINIPETIISSEEKFRSPEIKDMPVTPIQIRREPKNSPKSISKKPIQSMTLISKPQSPDSGIQNGKGNGTNSFGKSLPKEDCITPPKSKDEIKTPKSKSSKKATPIAVRRKPRVLLPSTVEQDSATEEALDTWPTPQTNKSDPIIVTEASSTIIPISNSKVEPMDFDDTENIRLVLEDDTQNEDDLQQQQDDDANKPMESSDNVTPNSKTPRRVELRTISTPKSKKKLL